MIHDRSVSLSKQRKSRRLIGRHCIAGYFGVALLLLICMTLGGGTIAKANAEERVLFAFDDQSIPWRDNLKLSLVPATKHPANPVLRKGPPGAPDYGHAILYGTVLRIDGKLRMWYVGMPDSNLEDWKKTRWRPMCYAESNDGVTWVKPELGLVEINGSKQNNACLIHSDADDYLALVDDFLSVIHDPEAADPERRYKCVFIAHLPLSRTKGGLRSVDGKLNALGDAGERVKGSKIKEAADPRTAVMMTAVSPDGLRWKVIGDRPAINEKLEISGLWKFGGYYYAAGQQLSPWTWRPDGSDTGREMVVFRSFDFENWSSAKVRGFTRLGQDLSNPVPGQQTHMGVGVWNRGNVLVGLTGLWQDGPKERPVGTHGSWGVKIDLGLVVSNDGFTFREPIPDFRVLSHGADHEWDSMALLQAHAFVSEGDQTMLWYSHWDTSGQLKNMEIGLATLRRDGFGYLTNKLENESASLVTAAQPANDDGWQLQVNVEGVSEKSPLIVELLDENLRPLEGYSASVVTNGTQVDVEFSHGNRIPKNKEVSIRVNLPRGSRTKFYALYLQ